MANTGQGYNIPFGLDSRDFFKGIDAIDSGLSATQQEAVDANKAIQGAFNQSGQAAEKFGNTVINEAKKLAQLREGARSLGKELGDAMAGKTVGANLEARIKQFTSQFDTLRKAAKIDVNIDAAKLKAFETQIAAATDEFKQLAVVIDFAKQKLDSLDTNSQEFAELSTQIGVAESFLKGMGEAADGVTNKSQTLKAELRQLKADMSALEIAGLGNSEEFKAMALRAGELEDQLGDVSARVRVLASDTKYIDAGVQAFTGLVGVVTAAQGAAALLGEENQDLALALQKVTGAMAVLQGIQAVANALNKDSALSILFLSKTQAAATVTTTGLAGATTAEAGATVAATTATNGFTAALLANPLVLILVALAALTIGIIAYVSASDDAEESTEDLTAALERQQKFLVADEAALKRRTDLLVAAAKSSGKAESDITTIEGRALAERINLRRDNLAELRQIYNQENADKKTIGEQIGKAEQELADLENEIQVKRIERTGQAAKEEKEAIKKRLEDLKKAQEEEKARRTQIAKFIAQAEDAELAAMVEGEAKQKAAAQLATARKLRDLNSEVTLSKEAAEVRKRATSQIENELAVELAKIDVEATKKRAELRLTGRKELLELDKDGVAKDLSLLRLEYEERKKQIEENYKNENDLRLALLGALETNFADKRKEIILKSSVEQLDIQERAARAQVELIYALGSESEKAEELKQRDILAVQLKYAQLRLKALLESGKSQSDVDVLETKALIARLQKEFDKAAKTANGPKFDIFSMLGLDDITGEQKKAIGDAVNSIMSSVSEVTGLIIKQYDEQINAHKKVIDSLNSDIDEIESALDREKDVRDDGFANNVELLEKELAVKQKARDEEIRREEELTKKKKQIQKIQMALDTVSQASNLITAASKIYASVAEIPFIGVALATGLVALMVAGFVTAKAMSFSAASSSQSFGEGGEVDGGSHDSGRDRKYYSKDGRNVRKLEGGEFVINKKATRKYKEMLTALNEDHLKDIPRHDLEELLRGTGIHIQTDVQDSALREARINHTSKIEVQHRSDDKERTELLEIARNVAYMANRKKDDPVHWEDSRNYYTKIGNVTTKNPKNGANKQV